MIIELGENATRILTETLGVTVFFILIKYFTGLISNSQTQRTEHTYKEEIREGDHHAI